MKGVKEINDKQRRFCALVAGGMAQGKAYTEAGYTCRGDTADQAASRMLRNVKVLAYLEELREQLRNKEVMKLEELQLYLSAAIRTPVGAVGPESPLCHEYTRVEKGGKGSSAGSDEEQIEFGEGGFEDLPNGSIVTKVKKVDPLRAAQLLIGTMGWNKPVEVNTNLTLGNVLDQIQSSPFPGANAA